MPSKAVKPKVALVRDEDGGRGLMKAWGLLGDPLEKLRPGARVLIKPNFTGAKPPETGAASDPRIAVELAKLALEAGAGRVILAEGIGSHDVTLSDVRGLEEMARMEGVEVVDLNNAETVEVVVPKPLVVDRFRVPRVVLECDFLINLAKLKVHPQALFSLAFKNLIGALPGRSYPDPEEARRQGYLTPIIPGGGKKVFHDLARDRGPGAMQDAIVDLNAVIRSDLTIIDGLYGMEGAGSPVRGRPVRMDLIIVSRDLVAAEAVGADVMGFDPRSISYLRHAVKKGLGQEHDTERIEVLGSAVRDVRRRFEPADAAALWSRT